MSMLHGKRHKASPSDVMFGQPPGSDEGVQTLRALSSDSSPASASHSRSGSRNSRIAVPPLPATAATVMPQGMPSSASSPASTSSSSQKRGLNVTSMTPKSNSSSTDSSMSVAVSSPRSPANGSTIQPQTQARLIPGQVVDGRKVLPRRLDDAEPDDILTLVADMLSRLMTHNDTLPLHPSSLTRFHSRATPGISIQSYLRRIAKYTSLDKACALIMLVYIDRVCEKMKGFTICSLTVHRFVCASVVCASKALCDAFSTNGHYARVGGISLIELNMLEKEFLAIIEWHLTCSGALLQHYYISLVGSHPAYLLEEEEEDDEEGGHEADTVGMNSSSSGSEGGHDSSVEDGDGIAVDTPETQMRSRSGYEEDDDDEEPPSAGALAEEPIGTSRHRHHHHQHHHRDGIRKEPTSEADRRAQQRSPASTAMEQ